MQSMTTTLFGPGGELRLLAASAANNVWTLGVRDKAGGPLVEQWDGRRWRVKPSSIENAHIALSGLAVVSDRDVWAVGSIFLAAACSRPAQR